MEFGTQSSTDAPGQTGVWPVLEGVACAEGCGLCWRVWPVLEGVAYAGRWGVGRGSTGK